MSFDDLNRDIDNNQEPIVKNQDVNAEEDNKNNLFNAILVLIAIILIFLMTNFIVVREEIKCNNLNECSYTKYGILNTPKYSKKFFHGDFRLYNIKQPDNKKTNNNMDKYRTSYIVSFYNDENLDVSKKVFSWFEEVYNTPNKFINHSSYRKPELILCLFILLFVLIGLRFYLFKDRKKVEYKKELRTIEIDRNI